MAARQRHERTARGALADSPDFLLRDTMDRFVRHPLVSPLFADDFVGLPPILVQAGECEFLRDESIALAFKIEQQNAGSTSSWVRHELYTDMVHVFQAVAWIPAAQLALRRIAHFIDHVDGRAPASPPLLTPEEAPLIHTIDSHCQL
nr:hypothetical protein HK105_006565 [Polyrhizophydium stewartii]